MNLDTTIGFASVESLARLRSVALRAAVAATVLVGMVIALAQIAWAYPEIGC